MTQRLCCLSTVRVKDIFKSLKWELDVGFNDPVVIQFYVEMTWIGWNRRFCRGCINGRNQTKNQPHKGNNKYLNYYLSLVQIEIGSIRSER